MKRLLLSIACLSVIAFAQADTVPSAPLAWNEALLTWEPPATFFDGTTLADIPDQFTYTLETQDPGKTDWRVIKVLTQTTYKHTGLLPGKHSWRVTVAFNTNLDLKSPPSSVVQKDVVLGQPGPVVNLKVQ